MNYVIDEDEWETKVSHRPCGSCQGDMRRCNGACTGRLSVERVRRDPAEVLRIKAARMASAQAQSRGCICPPGSERTCQGALCPRRALDLRGVSATFAGALQ